MRPISVGAVLSPTVKTTLYTVPLGYHALWNLAYAVNHSGNNKYVDIIWYDASSDSEFYVVDNYVLSPTQFIKFDGGAYIVLEEGDQVRATSETGSSMNVLCTFEVYRNKG
jgi:hypothetical protein